MSERSEQEALFDWIDWQTGQHPELKLAYAIPNGQMRRGQPKEPGMKKGVPDICLPVPRALYHGLYIELKVDDNKPTVDQWSWISALTQQGYLAVVRYGADEAIETICKYLGIEP